MAINELKFTGGHYTLISEWESDLPATLTEPEILECYAGGWTGPNGALEDTFTITGHTATAVNKPVIRNATGSEHNGVPIANGGSGFAVYGEVNTPTGYQYDIKQRYTEIIGIELIANGGTRGVTIATLNNETLFDSVILTQTGTASSALAVASNTSASDVTFQNCRIEVSGRGIDLRNSSGSVATNCTVITSTGDWGILGGVITGCVSVGFSSGDYHTSPVGDYNASSDTTAIGTNKVTNVSTADDADFVEPSTGDYTPTSDGALAGFIPGAPTLPTDIADNARNTPDDIGAYAVVGGVTPTQIDPDDLLQNQTLTNVTVTFTPSPADQIDPDDLSQNQTLTNVTLTYTVPNYTISVQDLTQNQTLTSVVTTHTPPTGSLSVNSLYQQQTLGNVTLTYTPPLVSLSVDDLAQNQTLTSVDIDHTPPQGVIAPESLYQGQYLDEVTLTFVPALVSLEVDDITQNQYIQTVRFGGLATGTLSGKVDVRPALDGQIVVYH